MLKIKAFGKIAEIVQQEEFLMERMESTEAMKAYLGDHYPGLKHLNYQIALDKKIMSGDASLSGISEVALLPPFSGG